MIIKKKSPLQHELVEPTNNHNIILMIYPITLVTNRSIKKAINLNNNPIKP